MSRRLRIKLSSQDPEIVDGATRKLVRFIGERHPYTPVATPQPARTEEFGEGISQRIQPRVIEVHGVDTELIVQLRQLNLPEGVQVEIQGGFAEQS